MFRTYPEVRRLLAKLREPSIIEGDPLARRLREVLGCASARDAVLRAIDRALAFSDPRLRKIVQRCDVDGVKVLAVASEFHLSSRQIFRYRGVAVEAIAATLEALLPADGDSQRILVQLCPRCLQESVRRDDVTVMSA